MDELFYILNNKNKTGFYLELEAEKRAVKEKIPEEKWETEDYDRELVQMDTHRALFDFYRDNQLCVSMEEFFSMRRKWTGKIESKQITAFVKVPEEEVPKLIDTQFAYCKSHDHDDSTTKYLKETFKKIIEAIKRVLSE